MAENAKTLEIAGLDERIRNLRIQLKAASGTTPEARTLTAQIQTTLDGLCAERDRLASALDHPESAVEIPSAGLSRTEPSGPTEPGPSSAPQKDDLKGIACEVTGKAEAPKLRATEATSQDASLVFLDDFFGEARRTLYALKKPGAPIAKTFDAPDKDGQRKFISGWNSRGYDIYFSPNPLKRAPVNKAGKVDVAEARWLWIDLDPRAKEPLAQERSKMLALLTDKLPKGMPCPNRVIDSGRGYWGFWKLATPQPVDGPGPLTAAVESYGIGIERAFGDRFADGCRNIDRIARLPGTVNHKTGGTAMVLAEYSYNEPHAIDSFPCASTKAAEPEEGAASDGPTEGASVNVTLACEYQDITETDDRLARLEPKWISLMKFGVSSAEGKHFDNDRSRAEFDFVCQCIRVGIDDNTIASILMKKEWHIGDSVRDQPNIDRSLKRVIERAHEFAIDPDLERMNREHHVVNMDGKTRVVSWKPNAVYRDRKDPIYSTFEDFEKLHSNRHKVFTVKDPETGEIKQKRQALGTWWLRQKGRKQYNGGMEYMPHVNADERDGILNLFQGFTVRPIPGNKHDGYLDHLRMNICSGNEDWYNYLIRWMARAVQLPELRGEVGVVFIGKKGVGKTFAVEEFGNIFGQHFLTVINPDHFAGKFNFHLQRCSVILADECFFAGDKKHEQIIKGLITGTTLFIEPKGLNAYQAVNYLHVFMCTNNDWAVPASEDERRWFCLEVAETHRADFAYFKKIRADMEAGGRANLLHFLLNLDLSDFEVRRVPVTDALKKQQARSRRGVDALVEKVCNDGRVPCADWRWANLSITTGYEERKGFDWFIDNHRDTSIRNLGADRVKDRLRKEWNCITGSSTRRWRSKDQRVSGVQWPPLPELRQLFVQRHGPQVWLDDVVTDWEAPNDGQPKAQAADAGTPNGRPGAWDVLGDEEQAEIPF
jgi:hypothetical protein